MAIISNPEQFGKILTKISELVLSARLCCQLACVVSSKDSGGGGVDDDELDLDSGRTLIMET